jgi:hypothetical protein
VLTAGFFFAPHRPGTSDGEESVITTIGPMVTVRTLSEAVRMFWTTPQA